MDPAGNCSGEEIPGYLRTHYVTMERFEEALTILRRRICQPPADFLLRGEVSKRTDTQGEYWVAQHRKSLGGKRISGKIRHLLDG